MTLLELGGLLVSSWALGFLSGVLPAVVFAAAKIIAYR